MKIKTSRTSPTFRLSKLYIGFLAFAVLAAWGTSVGFAFRPSLVTPRSALIATVPARSIPSPASPAVSAAKSTSTKPATTSRPLRSRAVTHPSSGGDVSTGSLPTSSDVVEVQRNVQVITLPPSDTSSTDTNSPTTTTTSTTMPADG